MRLGISMSCIDASSQLLLEHLLLSKSSVLLLCHGRAIRYQHDHPFRPGEARCRLRRQGPLLRILRYLGCLRDRSVIVRLDSKSAPGCGGVGEAERTGLAVRRHLNPLMVLGVLLLLHCAQSAILPAIQLLSKASGVRTSGRYRE